MSGHFFDLRVYYEDTDLAGIVYHANYLKFIERARTEALIAAGIDQAALRAETGLVFAVRRVEADFIAPARFQDLLRVETRAGEVRGARRGAGAGRAAGRRDAVPGAGRGGVPRRGRAAEAASRRGAGGARGRRITALRLDRRADLRHCTADGGGP